MTFVETALRLKVYRKGNWGKGSNQPTPRPAFNKSWNRKRPTYKPCTKVPKEGVNILPKGTSIRPKKRKRFLPPGGATFAWYIGGERVGEPRRPAEGKADGPRGNNGNPYPNGAGRNKRFIRRLLSSVT